jgi:hypothetical protein
MMQVAVFDVSHAPARPNAHSRKTDTSWCPVATVSSRTFANRVDPNLIRVNTKSPDFIAVFSDNTFEKLSKTIIL